MYRVVIRLGSKIAYVEVRISFEVRQIFQIHTPSSLQSYLNRLIPFPRQFYHVDLQEAEPRGFEVLY